jgi:hypothetical protein
MWELHHRIVGTVGMLVALVYFVLVLGANDDGLDGLLIVIVAAVIIVGIIPYLALSTFLVNRVRSRRGVVHAHLATLVILASVFGVLTFSCRS